MAAHRPPGEPVMIVAFLNENTLGHTSYLPRFTAELARRPELGITPRLMDALPLPVHLKRLGDDSVRGLRRFGLDFHATRWRLATSRHLREQLDRLCRRERIEAVVLNTQSMGLEMEGLDPSIPILVGLDATFRQLAASPWFAPNPVSRVLQPLTLGGLLRRERRLFSRVTRFLPWSEPVREALVHQYGIAPERISLLPPSMAAPPRRPLPRSGASTRRPQILFVGGDFARKGGAILLECHARHFADRCDLHLVTHGEVPAGPGRTVHRQLSAGSEPWRRCWTDADLFVFPSRLETFGIVLLEALAFEVPIISSCAGAAASILENGALGVLLPELTVEALRSAMESVLADPEGARARATRGRARFDRDFELAANSGRLARWIQESVGGAR